MKENETPKFIPKLHFSELTKVEQDVLFSVAKANQALTIYEIYAYLVIQYAVKFHTDLNKKISEANETASPIDKLFMKMTGEDAPSDTRKQIAYDLKKYEDFNKLAQHYNMYGAGIPAYNTVRKMCLDFVSVGWLTDRKITKRKVVYSMPDEIKKTIPA